MGRYNVGYNCRADGGRKEEGGTWQLLHECWLHWKVLAEEKEKEATVLLGSSQESFPLIKLSLIWAAWSNF